MFQLFRHRGGSGCFRDLSEGSRGTLQEMLGRLPPRKGKPASSDICSSSSCGLHLGWTYISGHLASYMAQEKESIHLHDDNDDIMITTTEEDIRKGYFEEGKQCVRIPQRPHLLSDIQRLAFSHNLPRTLGRHCPGPCSHLPCGVLFDIDSYCLLEFFWITTRDANITQLIP